MRYVIIIAILCIGCRSANWYLQKAIDKGAKIDTTKVARIDSILFNTRPVNDMVKAEPDSILLQELCEDVPKNLHKFSKAVCPQLDSVYKFLVENKGNGKTYVFEAHVVLKDGTYKLDSDKFSIPYETAVTKVDITANKGSNFKELVSTCSVVFLIAVIIGFIIGLNCRRKP